MLTAATRCNTQIILKSYLDSQQQSFSPPHPRYQTAEALSRALFPIGASDIVRLSYAQEYEEVSSLLKGLDSDELKPHVEELPDLSFLIANLRQKNAEYGGSLSSGPDGPSSDHLRAARDRGHELLALTVVLIAAQSRSPTQTPNPDTKPRQSTSQLCDCPGPPGLYEQSTLRTTQRSSLVRAVDPAHNSAPLICSGI